MSAWPRPSPTLLLLLARVRARTVAPSILLLLTSPPPPAPTPAPAPAPALPLPLPLSCHRRSARAAAVLPEHGAAHLDRGAAQGLGPQRPQGAGPAVRGAIPQGRALTDEKRSRMGIRMYSRRLPCTHPDPRGLGELDVDLMCRQSCAVCACVRGVRAPGLTRGIQLYTEQSASRSIGVKDLWCVDKKGDNVRKEYCNETVRQSHRARRSVDFLITV